MLKIRRVVATQRGFTLIELLVGMTVGLIVLTGLIYGWGLYVQQSTYLLTSAQLANDLRATLQVVTQDLRRATQQRDAVTGLLKGSAVDLVCRGGSCAAATGDCVMFDANVDTVDYSLATPMFVPSGYRLDAGRLQMWNAAPTSSRGQSLGKCNEDPGSWETIAQVGESGITALNFVISTAGSRCLTLFNNIKTEVNRTCLPTETEKVELLLMDITLSGTASLGAGGDKAFSFTDSIKIRNDAVY